MAPERTAGLEVQSKSQDTGAEKETEISTDQSAASSMSANRVALSSRGQKCDRREGKAFSFRLNGSGYDFVRPSLLAGRKTRTGFGKQVSIMQLIQH